MLCKQNKIHTLPRKGCLCVLGSFLMFLSLANFSALANLIPYVTSYLRARVDASVKYSQMNWLVGFLILGEGSLMWLAGFVTDRFGGRITASFGAFIYCLFVGVSYFTIQYGLISLIATFGFLSWIGGGVLSIPALAIPCKWFPSNAGLVLGIINSAYAVGGVMFAQIDTFIINPTNIQPNSSAGYFTDEVLLDAVPKHFIIKSLIMLALNLLGIILLFDVPSVKISKENLELTNKVDSRIPGYSKNSPDILPKAIFRERNFYYLYFTGFVMAIPASFFISYYKSYGLTFIQDDHFLAYMCSFVSAASFVGTIITGLLADKVSIKCAYYVTIGVLAVSIQLMFVAQFINNYVKLVYSLVLVFGSMAAVSVYSLLPTATSQIFGIKHSGANIGILFTSQSFGSIFGSAISQFVINTFQWTWTFSIMFFIAIVGTLGVVLIIPIPRRNIKITR